MLLTLSPSLDVNSSAIDSCTNSRSIEMHSCPAFENSARSAPSTARPRSASPRTIIAFLPPSSIEAPMRLPPGALGDGAPGGRGPGKHHVVRAVDEVRAELGARAGDDLHQPGRQAGL